jgi:uncharacterized protein (DUF1330 family)
MSALMIANITVKNPEKFQEYIAKTSQVAATFGAELLYRGTVDRALTGESKDHGLTIIVKFPSLEKINEWYGSDAYRPLKALREEAADMQMTSYDVMA